MFKVFVLTADGDEGGVKKFQSAGVIHMGYIGIVLYY